MANDLKIVDKGILTEEEVNLLDKNIDSIISRYKNNRVETNKLVFESVAAMSVGDEYSKKLASKSGVRRFVGNITGSNKELQDKINENRSAAQYAAQLTLQKLSEQNLMTFDLLTAINNKLNAAVLKTDEEINKVLDVLVKFFKKNKSELVRLENRLDIVERNLNLVTWTTKIEYNQFDDVDYLDLDDVEKIVCLISDFYEITKGEWSTDDLMLLKKAMDTIEISPKEKVNYYDMIKSIAYDQRLKTKIMGSIELEPITEPEYLISMSCMQKLDALCNEDAYLVDALGRILLENGLDADNKAIAESITESYMVHKAGVSLNCDLTTFDFILDILYNLKQYESMVNVVNQQYEITEVSEEVPAEEIVEEHEKTPEEQAEEAYELAQNMYYGNKETEIDYEKAFENYSKAVELGKKEAALDIARCYLEGKGVRKNSKKGFSLCQELAEAGNDEAKFIIAKCYEDGIGTNKDAFEAYRLYKQLSKKGNADAMFKIGSMYDRYMLEDDDGEEDERAFEWYMDAAEHGHPEAAHKVADCYYFGTGTDEDESEADYWYDKAKELGYEDKKRSSSGGLFSGLLSIVNKK